MWRAVTLPAGPAPRPVIDVLVDFDPVAEERLSAVMTELAAAISEAEARPVRLLASISGALPNTRSWRRPFGRLTRPSTADRSEPGTISAWLTRSMLRSFAAAGMPPAIGGHPAAGGA